MAAQQSQPVKTPLLPANLYNEKGDFKRPQASFRNFISNKPGARFPPTKGRYHLYVSYACPWAHRTLIVRKLKGLEDIISFTAVHYHIEMPNSWRFVRPEEKILREGYTPDPLHPGAEHISDLYLRAAPDYSGRFSVPVLWDKQEDTIVNNESSEIIRMFYTEFDELLPERYRGIDLYPEPLRKDIDLANEWIYDNINNGVYKCGLAANQSAYKTAVDALFLNLDKVEAHLSSPNHVGPYYFGSRLCEVDIRLYVTIIRFDPVYVSLFKTNRRMIRYSYPAIHQWLRNLYWNVPAFRETTDFEHIKGHYFMSLTMLNPSGVIPDGPVPHIESLN